ncbi:MAG TPA: DUF4132 domain-containing protein [Anaerolineales bacterium]|nr:DUF4132 domain-containing protein [Anaerolineales bacterium]
MRNRFPTAMGTEEALVEEIVRQPWRGQPFQMESFQAGQRILQAEPEAQVRAAMGLIRWLEKHGVATYDSNNWKMRAALFTLLKKKLPLREQDLIRLLEWSAHVRSNNWRGLPEITKVLGDYVKENGQSKAVVAKVESLIEAVESSRMTVEDQRRVMRLNGLIGRKEIRLPLQTGDGWAEAALADIHEQGVEQQTAWAELLLHCLRASGSAPSKKWLQDAEAKIKAAGEDSFCAAVLRWFLLADRPRRANKEDGTPDIPLPANADVLKGLAWCCSRFDRPEIARALAALAISAYRRQRGAGPRAVKIGNACFWALGTMPCDEAMAQLSILKARIKGTSPQKAISAAMNMAARRTGLSAEEMEELRVPTYGLDEVGSGSFEVGNAMAHIRIVGSSVEQSWEQDGKQLVSAPKDIKENHPEDVKQIDQAVKEVQRMVTAQKERIDGLYLAPRKWTLKTWRERYLEHPITGSIGRRLIWKFSKGDRAESGIWSEGRIVARDDRPLDWLDEGATVELWHPISAQVEVVTAWRQWLLRYEVQQPFKQAHREVYPLTDPERATEAYSNRYAAHILRQHQFNALCAARGWKNSLRLRVDTELPPARKELPQWGLRAEFWVQGIGDAEDTNDTGTFLYLTTDQVRFYRADALENRAHAGGGAYFARRWNNRGSAEPVRLDEIPPLVFSEVMRDVDMFVSVSSVGNDPNWLDGGAGIHYREYWQGYSFGELSESARVRKQVLEGLLPRLKIAGRCELTDRFLVVSGELRRYKIHLGSGNILMEPNDQYLCIVPARGGLAPGKEHVFLPFEGDQTLAVILSKAFMLAEDRTITDQTIVRQLKSGV